MRNLCANYASSNCEIYLASALLTLGVVQGIIYGSRLALFIFAVNDLGIAAVNVLYPEYVTNEVSTVAAICFVLGKMCVSDALQMYGVSNLQSGVMFAKLCFLWWRF